VSFFDEYFKYVGRTEAPMIYLRWSTISMVAAALGRNCWFPFGHKKIYPNMYILLMGTPGARKGTGLGITRTIMEAANYRTFAKDRTSMERFISDMQPRLDIDDGDLEALVLDVPAECYICMDEFLDFIGHGNMPFLTLLTNLWDNKDSYEHPKLHGASIHVYKPTINILGAATVKGLGLAVPPEALGTGILSRILLVHSDPTDEKITWPEEVPEDAHAWLVQRMKDIRENIKGKMSVSEEGLAILDRVYKEFPGIEDARFNDYVSRRFTHLLKLCIVVAAMDLRMEVTVEDVLQANTILHMAEKNMPRALGEFGKSKHSDVTNTVMGILNHAVKPVLHSRLWKACAKDLTKQSELHDIMRNLLAADKV